MSPSRLLLVLFTAGLIPLGAAQQNGISRKSVAVSEQLSVGKSLYHKSYALVIGINEYPNLPKQLWLHYAENDAKDLAEILIHSYGFERKDVKLLLGADATRDAVLAALSAYSDTRKIDKNDRVIVYFSGHGQTVKSGTGGDVGFLIPEDASVDLADVENPGPYASTCLSMKDFWERLSLSPAKHTLVIADACFGGLFASRKLSGEMIASQLARPARMALTAGGKGETSEERGDLGHGLFTYKLLEELRARAASGNPFLISDLYSSLVGSVGEMSHGTQNPQLKSDETEGQLVFSPVADSGLSFTASEARDLYEKKQFSEAFAMFQQLADRGDPDALAGLASCYLLGNGIPKDVAKALSYARSSADKGSPWGMDRLGRCLIGSTPPNYSEALKWTQKAAELGDPPGMFDLAYMFNYGQGVPRDMNAAVNWYRKAAVAGSTVAMTNLGFMYDYGQGVVEDAKEAINWYRKAAEAGEPEAMNDLACMYRDGKGVAQDDREALIWLRKAVAAESLDAMNCIGYMYENGRGVERDYKEAATWYRKAAEAGLPDAMTNLGILYEMGSGVDQDYKRAATWYRNAAKGGSGAGMVNLGALYARGDGVKQDYKEALTWYLKAANLGFPEGMSYLGSLYRTGHGVPQDYKQAATWYRKAADLHSTLGMTNLGFLYYSGLGMPQNFLEAEQWYEKAAEEGDAGAMNSVGSMYRDGQGVARDYTVALSWYRKSADAGNSDAMSNLGVLYTGGLGVDQDYGQAISWFRKSAEAGSFYGMFNLGVFYELGRAVEKDKAQALIWYRKSAALGYQSALDAVKRLGG